MRAGLLQRLAAETLALAFIITMALAVPLALFIHLVVELGRHLWEQITEER